MAASREHFRRCAVVPLLLMYAVPFSSQAFAVSPSTSPDAQYFLLKHLHLLVMQGVQVCYCLCWEGTPGFWTRNYLGAEPLNSWPSSAGLHLHLCRVARLRTAPGSFWPILLT